MNALVEQPAVGPSWPAGWPEVEGYELHQLVRCTRAHDAFLAYRRANRTFWELIVVRPQSNVDAGALRLAVEAEVAAAGVLTHPGTSPARDVGATHDGRLYVASVRPVGRVLADMLAADGPLPPRVAFDLGRALVEAVAAAHEVGVVHGRLSPESVVVVPQQAGRPERVVVLGFGTAEAQDGTLTPAPEPAEQVPYASPERAAGGPASLRGDVFSLGSVILAMLIGGPPPAVRAALAPPADTGPDDVLAVLRRARSVSREQRHATAGQLAAALEAAEPTVATFDVRRLPAASRGAQEARGPVRGVSPGARVVGAVAAGICAFGVGWGARAWQRHQADLVLAERQSPAVEVAQRSTPAATLAPALAPAPTTPAREEQLLRGPVPTPPPALPSVALAPATPAPNAARQASTVATRRTVPASAAAAPAAAPTAGSAAGDVVAEARPAAPASESTTVASADASSAASREAGVRAAVAEYARAIEARDLAGLGRVNPGMTEQQRRAWVTFFGSVGDVRARLVVAEVTASGGTTQARVHGTYEYQNLRPRRAERSPVNFTATLARDGSAWRLRAVE